MLSLEVRKKAGGAEVHRVPNGAVTVGASSGNEVVVRARGVAGRHLRIFERDGHYQVDLFKGVDAVTLNGREFVGGPIAPGDRIAVGEATITVINIQPGTRPTPVHEMPVMDMAASVAPAAATSPSTEVEYRSLRLSVYRLCRENGSPEDLATAFVDFFDREFAPTEWAAGELSYATGFRPLASTFLEHPAIPPHLLEEVRLGERVVRSESVTGVLTLVVEPRESGAFAILVRETPRLAARVVLFLEEAVQIAGVAARAPILPAAASASAPEPAADPHAGGPIESILRQTDDLKKIVETVEREIIDRAMRRVEGNQSRGAEILNISRGSLIAKLKDFEIPDYRYLRRERQKRS
jgi:pSer/pThr/pTyr-binding forkhead associated (FHA) protein